MALPQTCWHVGILVLDMDDRGRSIILVAAEAMGAVTRVLGGSIRGVDSGTPKNSICRGTQREEGITPPTPSGSPRPIGSPSQ